MSVGRFDSSAYSATITDTGTHAAGQWPVNLSVPAIGVGRPSLEDDQAAILLILGAMAP